MNLLNAIKSDFLSKYKYFPKLKKGVHYEFIRISKDRANEDCLYYRVGKNIKKVVIRELQELLEKHQNNTTPINRKQFAETCIKTYQSGPCGYCVSVRILEYLGIGKYLVRMGFVINPNSLH